MATVRSGDLDIYYEDEGRGPALVLYTGAGGDLRIWRYAGYPRGLTGFRLLLIDQRGRGRSGRPSSVEEHRMERHVEDVAAVMDAVGVTSAGFWGYSLGFAVGLAFGATFPGRLQALVGTGAMALVDLTDLPPIPDRGAFIAQVVAEGGVRADVDRLMKSEQDRFPDDIDRNVRETDPLMGALRRIAWRSWRGPKSLVPLVRAPVLVIQGEKEDREGATEPLVAALPRGRLVTLPDQGHLSAFYRSDLALAHVQPFLQTTLRDSE
jgi:pimeloyl-ACP methyl ester carboxylesterase